MRFIIDLDGTLLNSFNRHYVLLQDIFKANGNDCKINKEIFLNMKTSGYSTKNICREGFGIGEKLSEEIAKEWVQHIEDVKYLELDFLYEDTQVFLQKIKKQGNITILTARKNEQRVLQQIATLGLGEYVDETIVVDPKNAAVEKKGVLVSLKKKDEVVMIGDTEADYDAAMQVNIPCYILNRGFRSKEYWDKRGIVSFTSLNEILSEV